MPEIDHLVPLRDAFAMIGLSRSRGYEELASGRLKAKKLGRLTLVPVSEIRRFIDALPDAIFSADAAE